MNKRIKKIWIKALLSGEYKQGRECLVQSYVPEGSTYKLQEFYCCMGVLKAVSPIRMHKSKLQEILSPASLKKIGMTPGQQCKLTKGNDGGWSFKRIAKWIGENL